MEEQKSHFHRNLLIVLGILFGITLAVLSYPNWALDWGTEPLWMRLLNLLILSIPLVLLYGSAYVLLMGWHERSTLGKVSPRLAGIIHWAPRIAAILIILFTGVFSLDVFGEGASPLEVLGAFLMHNIPSIASLSCGCKTRAPADRNIAPNNDIVAPGNFSHQWCESF